MAAFERACRQARQIAAGFDAETRFELFGQRRVAHGRAAVEDDAADPALRLELQKALHRGQHGQRRAARVHDQYRGAGGLLRSLPCARARGGEAEAVIVAHDALDDGDGAACGVLREQIPERRLVKEKRVEIRAFCADDAAVEHGVDVIRAAFGRGDAQPPVYQRLQNGASHGRLPAAAVRPGDHEPG